MVTCSGRALPGARSGRLGLGRALVGALLAAAAPAALARPGIGQEHRLAGFPVGALERAPPGLKLGRDLAARRAQRQEIVGHAKAWRLEQAVGALPGALLEARLHGPDLAHRRSELS